MVNIKIKTHAGRDYFPLCNTKDCPCHTEQKCGHLLFSDEGYGKYKIPPRPDKIEARCDNIVPCPHHTEQKGWREELRRALKLSIQLPPIPKGTIDLRDRPAAEKFALDLTDMMYRCVEPVVERTLTAQREEMVKKLPERTKYFSERNGLKEPSDYQKGYDDCLAAIQALIKDTKPL